MCNGGTWSSTWHDKMIGSWHVLCQRFKNLPKPDGVARQVRDMREQLAEATRSKEGAELFEALYRSWSHSVGASLCLCFLAQAYGHACDLIAAFSHLPLGVEVLVQVRQIAQLHRFCLKPTMHKSPIDDGLIKRMGNLKRKQ